MVKPIIEHIGWDDDRDCIRSWDGFRDDDVLKFKTLEFLRLGLACSGVRWQLGNAKAQQCPASSPCSLQERSMHS